MKSAKNILVIGELNVDILLNDIQGLPKIGTEIIADQMDVVLGSSSAIFASNASSLGMNVAFSGAIGSDHFGKIIIDALGNSKVDTTNICIKEGKATGATIVMNYDQDRANVTYCGAMNDFSTDDIPWDNLKSYHHVHLSNFFIQKLIRRDIAGILKRIKDEGLSVSLDLQWDVLELWDFDYKILLPLVDVFMPSENELLQLTDKDSVTQAIETVRPYIHIMALKRGTKGSIGVTRDQYLVSPAFKVTNFTDAIGAGDSFNAGFIAQFLENASLKECLENGNLMGAHSTSATGGTLAFQDNDYFKTNIEKLRSAALKME